MENVAVPKAESDASPAVRYLNMAATGFALVATVAGLVSRMVEHLQKPKAQPGARTNVGTTMLGLTVLKALPGIIKTSRTLAAQAKRT